MCSIEKNIFTLTGHKMDRRHFLSMGFLALASCFVPTRGFSAMKEMPPRERTLFLNNLHTGESLKTVFWRNGTYVPESLEEINFILRDHYSDQIHTIDKSLLSLLCALQRKLHFSEPFQIVSGYRSPETNALMRKKSRGVAKSSLHMSGKAVDIRVSNCDLNILKDATIQLQRGGVGYYPQSNFIHVDVGEIRYW